MQVKAAIEQLQTALDNGWMKPEEEIVITWWSAEDVDIMGDTELTPEQKTQVWLKVVEELNWYDDFDNSVVQALIFEQMEKLEKNV
jgi:hypothetical protein